jgi:biotin transport system ATP-binding protein
VLHNGLGFALAWGAFPLLTGYFAAAGTIRVEAVVAAAFAALLSAAQRVLSTQVRDVRRRVGFVFQDPDAQIVHPTVAEDVAFGLENQGVPPQERTERVAEVLGRYGLAGHADHPAHLLSGGQKQLLAIAGVLVMRPARIVFDEPTTLLDLVNARRIARVVAGLEQSVVVVTHDLDLLGGFDRVLVVDGGRVVEDGPAEQSVRAYRKLMADR